MLLTNHDLFMIWLLSNTELSMSSRGVPEGNCDVVVRMDEELKAALAERARVECRSVPNLMVFAAQCYLAGNRTMTDRPQLMEKS